MITQKPVSDAAYDVLKACRVEGTLVFLPAGQLDRKLYEDVNDALLCLGGKWHKGKKAHVFPANPQAALDTLLETGRKPPKNPLSFFETPPEIAQEMVACIPSYWIGTPLRILEPSAGRGALADAIHVRLAMRPDCIELDPINQKILEGKGYHVIASDFLTYHATNAYNAILMNPPFAVEGNPTVYVEHITHAFSMLEDCGILVAIAPAGFTFTEHKKLAYFHDLVVTQGSWEVLPEDAFKASGTGVRTVLIQMRKG